ncbi:unnamed protein product, partial [Timema podura]|nr:unnamed protein product [Timema podura]
MYQPQGFKEEGNRSNSFAYPPVNIPIQLVDAQTHHVEDDHKMNVDVDRILPPSLIKDMILDGLRYPVVFRGLIFDWEMLDWSPQAWVEHLGDMKLPFRRGQKKVTESPQWERGCSTEQLTMAEFFQEDTSDSWLYFDYKYMHEWFQDHPNILQTDPLPLEVNNLVFIHCVLTTYSSSMASLVLTDSSQLTSDSQHLDLIGKRWAVTLMLDWPADDGNIGVRILVGCTEAVTWANLGFPERTGSESTMWIGSSGAHTPCHIDTYGCNIVAQVMGRKQWILFPPSAPAMLPTRVPYEESSIYSNRNFYSPGPDMAEAPSRLEQNNKHEHVRDKCGWFFEQNIVTKCVRCSVRHRSTSCRFLLIASKDIRVRSCSSLDTSANIYVNISPNIQSLAGQQQSHTCVLIFVKLTQARVVTLNPGDVLFVPHHWWHYVENITTAISINTWISLLCKDLPSNHQQALLNPSEDDLPDLPLSVAISQVDTCLNLCHKIKEESPDSPDKVTQISNSPTANKKPKRDCTSYVDVLSQYGDNVMLVPVCPYVELKTLLSKKREALLGHITDANKYSPQSSLETCENKCLEQTAEENSQSVREDILARHL